MFTISADFNDWVKDDQVLAELDLALFQAQVKQNEANVLAAQAAALDLARIEIDRVVINLRNSAICSPISGVAVARSVDNGSERRRVPNADAVTVEPRIRVAGLGKDYPLAGGGATPVLRRIHLDIAPDEFVAIMGPWGSGQSTFMNILGGLDTPSAGGCWLADRTVARLNPDELAALRTALIMLGMIIGGGALAFLFAVGTGVFFGFYPARKAALLKPVEALGRE